MNINEEVKFIDISCELSEIDELAQILADSVENRLSNDKPPVFNDFTINFLSKKVTKLNKRYERLLDDYYTKISRK